MAYLSHLDLPLEAYKLPQYWVSALYVRDPRRGYVLQRYTPMQLGTYLQHFDSIFYMQPKPAAKVTWVWFGGQWVRVRG